MNATAQIGVRSDETKSTNNIPPSYPVESDSIAPTSDDANDSMGDINADYYRIVSKIKAGDKTIIVEAHDIDRVGVLQRDILIVGDSITMSVTFLNGLRAVWDDNGECTYLPEGVSPMGEVKRRIPGSR